MKLQAKIALWLFVVLASWDSMADSWVAATPTINASRDANILVRVAPGSNLGAVVGFEGEKKGVNATATWFKYDGANYRKLHEATLLNPIAPVDVEVANSGAIVTLDNWHNMGYGPVIANYSAEGKLLKAYKLDEIFSAEEIKSIQHTVSSIWWRCENSSRPYWDNTNSTLTVNDALNGTITIELKNGSIHRERDADSCPK
jgi:hypothetical protein